MFSPLGQAFGIVAHGCEGYRAVVGWSEMGSSVSKWLIRFSSILPATKDSLLDGEGLGRSKAALFVKNVKTFQGAGPGRCQHRLNHACVLRHGGRSSPRLVRTTRTISTEDANACNQCRC